MKIFPVFFWLLCVGLVSGQGKRLRITAESADIHIEPHKSSMVIETVKKGAILTLFDTGRKQKDWLYISYYLKEKWVTITGFVEASLVEEIVEESRTEKEDKPAVAPRKIPVRKKIPVKRPKKQPPVKALEKKIELAQTPPPEPILIPFSGRVRITSPEAVLRTDAETDAKIIRKFKLDESLEAIGVKGDWYRVRYPQEDGLVLTGFIFKDHIEVISGEATEKAAEAVAQEKVEKEPVKPPEVQKKAEAAEEIEKLPETELEAQPEYREPIPAFGDSTLGLGIDVGYAMPGESQYSGALKYGLYMSCQLNRYLAVELSGFRFQSDVTGESETLSSGKLSIIPITLSIQGRYPLTARIIPYAYLGGGYCFNTFALDSGISQPWDDLGFDVSEKVKNSVGFHFGAGLDYFLTSEIAIRADVRYLLASASGEWRQVDQISGVEASGEIKDISLNSLVLGVGIKFQFKLF